jgi:hypothetical protein
MEMTVFWDVAPCNLVEINKRFGDVYYLHRQVDDQILRDYMAQQPSKM